MTYLKLLRRFTYFYRVVAVLPELKETPRGNPVFIGGLIDMALRSDPIVLKLFGDVVCISAILSF